MASTSVLMRVRRAGYGSFSKVATGGGMTTKSVEERFEEIAKDELTLPGVTEGTGFGSNAGLRIGGKIFAM